MRTHFEPAETEEFEQAKHLLVRRCSSWAHQHNLTCEPIFVETAMDFRHSSVDGQLTYWSPEVIREFLLAWVPRKVSMSADEAADAPETLRTLLLYLRATQLDTPGAHNRQEADDAIDSAAADFPEAMSTKSNFGLAKFWVMNAIERGVDPSDNAAMQQFIDQVNSGEIEVDQAALGEILHQRRHSFAAPERAPSMPPVTLPDEVELSKLGEESRIVDQLRKLVEWLGTDGRMLTKTGQLKLADARELVTLLDTGDVINPVIGDRTHRTQSSADLRGLVRLVRFAIEIRLVRTVKNRLVPIAKARPLLRDGQALWAKAFDALPDLADFVVKSPEQFGDHAVVYWFYGDCLHDVLATLYGFTDPVPVPRLQEGTWLACADIVERELPEHLRQLTRSGVDNDLRRMLEQLAEFGAVELTSGNVDPMFFADLGGDIGPEVPATMPPESQATLREAMSPHNGPVEHALLTPLGTHAVRRWLQAQGRNVPVVGELVDAEPAHMLGAVVDQHTPDSAHAEIEIWLANRAGDGFEQLVDAIRQCPFRARAAAMLRALVSAHPEGTSLLQLRNDESLGPLVAQALITSGELAHEDLTEAEWMLLAAEQLLQALEQAGPDTVIEMLTDQGAPDMVAAALESGHPAVTGMEELRTLVAEPLLG